MVHVSWVYYQQTQHYDAVLREFQLVYMNPNSLSYMVMAIPASNPKQASCPHVLNLFHCSSSFKLQINRNNTLLIGHSVYQQSWCFIDKFPVLNRSTKAQNRENRRTASCSSLDYNLLK